MELPHGSLFAGIGGFELGFYPRFLQRFFMKRMVNRKGKEMPNSAESVMSSLPARLRRIKVRCDKATRGPWTPWNGNSIRGHHRKLVRDDLSGWICETQLRSDQVFIARARSDIPYLLFLIKALLSVVKVAKKVSTTEWCPKCEEELSTALARVDTVLKEPS